MKRYEVHVSWTDWLEEGSEHFDATRALYMYATKREPIYVGETKSGTVRERLHGHKADVIAWIRKNIKAPVAIKVGAVHWGPDFEYREKRLYDIQTLLIYKESNERGYCRANVASTRSRPSCRPGMVVVNCGTYRPLRKRYRDSEP